MVAALTERKKRLSLKLPVRVRGEDAAGKTFEESTRCLNVSGGGILFESRERLLVGTRIHLRIEIPEALRKHFDDQSDYETSAIITRLEALESRARVRVGARFIADERR